MTETNGNVVVRLLKSLIRGLKMTHKFKIGDEVKVGCTYVVSELYGTNDNPSYLLEANGRCSHIVLEEDLELLNKPKETEMEKPKFKVGDRVRFKGAGEGYLYEITYCFGSGEYYLSNTICGLSGPNMVDEDVLELIDDKPAEPFEPVESVNSKVERQMKFEIYDEKKEQNSIILKLSDGEAGSVCVDIVYKNGVMKGPIVRFNTDGTITRYHSVDKSYGFKLDEEGRISIRER
jgi:hypothetical protein